MPEKKVVQRARKKAREGKSPSTQAGEFVREEIHHVREGKHGARSPEQAIAIGLSKARKAGVKLPPKPASGKKSSKPRSTARRSSKSAVSHSALSKHAHESAVERGPKKRKQAARKAARTRSKRTRP